MKAITSQFFGVFGSMVHAAICSASQQNIQYKGGICSKLNMIGHFVNIPNSQDSIFLAAKFRNDRLSEFFSRYTKIRTSNLKSFFTLNVKNAHGLIGMTGLLTKKLACLGISFSKKNFFFPDFHFSLSMNKKEMKPHLMIQRMMTTNKEICKDSSSARLQEDIESQLFFETIVSTSSDVIDENVSDSTCRKIPDLKQITKWLEAKNIDVSDSIMLMSEECQTAYENLEKFEESVLTPIQQQRNRTMELFREKLFKQIYDLNTSIEEQQNFFMNMKASQAYVHNITNLISQMERLSQRVDQNRSELIKPLLSELLASCHLIYEKQQKVGQNFENVQSQIKELPKQCMKIMQTHFNYPPEYESKDKLDNRLNNLKISENENLDEEISEIINQYYAIEASKAFSLDIRVSIYLKLIQSIGEQLEELKNKINDINPIDFNSKMFLPMFVLDNLCDRAFVIVNNIQTRLAYTFFMYIKDLSAETKKDWNDKVHRYEVQQCALDASIKEINALFNMMDRYI